GIDDDRRETVRIVSRSNRPGARQRVDVGGHIDVVRVKPERVTYDLCRNRRVALAVRTAAQAQRDLSAWIDGDYGAGICARFAVRPATVFGGLREGDIGHI